MAPDCRVRKLHIRAYDQTVVPRLTFLLEDALRTASFPGIPANGMVYVRRLDLGRHRFSVSSRVLAGKIDDLLRGIRPVVITEICPEQPSASAVWFPEALSPYRFMIKLLAANHQPRSWYWPTAIKGWHSKLSARESYDLILAQVSAQKTGIRGLSFVIEPLLFSDKIHDLLHPLSRQGAARLLLTMGLKPAHDFPRAQAYSARPAGLNAQKATEAPLSLAPGAQETIAKAIRRWSVFDPRTMLLSYLILTSAGRKPDPFEMDRLLISLADTVNLSRSRQNHISEPGITAAAVTENEVPNAQRSDGRKGKKHISIHSAVQRTPAIRKNVDQNQNGRISSPSQMELLVDLADPKSMTSDQQNPISEPGITAAAVTENEVPNAQRLDGGKKREHSIHSAVQRTTAIRKNGDQNRNGLISSSPLPKTEAIGNQVRLHKLTEPWPLFGGLAGELSEYAGLVFLFPLLKRLGIESLLDTYPAYEEIDLPGRIIFRCARLLHIPPDDPALQFLGEEQPIETVQSPEFAAPPEWRKIILGSSPGNPRFRLCRVKGMPGRRLLFDEKVRLILGVWHSKNRGLLAPWLEASQRPIQSAAPQSWSLKRLEDNFVLAMSRYVRRYAKMGLASLIRRPAYVATTGTHIDVSIPFNLLDIRVRMAGLDIDPGWVPWLGRVIQFHYVGGER
jgi:hypothetical protein